MFASLVFAAFVFIPGVAPGDQALCPPRHHPPPAPVFPEPAAGFDGAPWDPDTGPLRATPTRASDDVRVPLDGAKWFQWYVGGAGNGTYALYDTTSHAYYACVYADTAVTLLAYQAPIGWIARAIPARPFGIRFVSAHGIRFGSNVAAVEHVYGPSQLQGFAPMAVLQYEKDKKVGLNTFGTTNTFYFYGGRLIGFRRDSGF